jgi:SAM-dependent methyltransferase
VEREQYDVMFRREERHWWYSGMRRVALSVLRGALRDMPRPRILDAGCGTGGTTVHLREFGGSVYGVDLSWDALQPAATRGLDGGLARGTIERLPFRDGVFDAVTSFEVVYHLNVGDDRRVFAEFRRVLAANGCLLLRLPAHDWLRGHHDRLVQTRHRYTRGEVAEKLGAAGFRIERLTWANSALFPPAVAKRLLERNEDDSAADEPDLWQPPAPLNWAMEQVVLAEMPWLTAGLNLPFGLSVLALARPA